MAFKCVLSIPNIALLYNQPAHAAQLQCCSIELCSRAAAAVQLGMDCC